MEHIVMREERYRAIREEKYEQYMVPSQEDPVKITLEHFGKLAEQKAFVVHQRQNYYQQDGGHKGPYLHATVVNQGQYQHYQQPVAHKGHSQQAYTRNQVPPLKKHGGVMDCNEVAKLYGGVVFTDYGRNKFTLRT